MNPITILSPKNTDVVYFGCGDIILRRFELFHIISGYVDRYQFSKMLVNGQFMCN